MISRRFLLVSGLAGLLVSLPAWPGARADAVDPKAFVTRLADSAMEAMVSKTLNDQQRISRFRSLFTTAVDLPAISHRVLARYWSRATPAQQTEFLKLFEDVVVLTWSVRFKDYGEDLKHYVVNVIDDGERGLTVESRVDRPHQPPIALQWRLRRDEANGFRVVDLVVEGVSMAITYRDEYAAVIRANNDQIEGLLVAMRTNVTKLQANPAG
jgi:phospholipid transport system substrate-binding protein